MIADFILGLLGVPQVKATVNAQIPPRDAAEEVSLKELEDQHQRLVSAYPVGSEWIVLGQRVVVIEHRKAYINGSGSIGRFATLLDDPVAVVVATRLASGEVAKEVYREMHVKALFRRPHPARANIIQPVGVANA